MRGSPVVLQAERASRHSVPSSGWPCDATRSNCRSATGLAVLVLGTAIVVRDAGNIVQEHGSRLLAGGRARHGSDGGPERRGCRTLRAGRHGVARLHPACGSSSRSALLGMPCTPRWSTWLGSSRPTRSSSGMPGPSSTCPAGSCSSPRWNTWVGLLWSSRARSRWGRSPCWHSGWPPSRSACFAVATSRRRTADRRRADEAVGRHSPPDPSVEMTRHAGGIRDSPACYVISTDRNWSSTALNCTGRSTGTAWWEFSMTTCCRFGRASR